MAIETLADDCNLNQILESSPTEREELSWFSDEKKIYKMKRRNRPGKFFIALWRVGPVIIKLFFGNTGKNKLPKKQILQIVEAAYVKAKSWRVSRESILYLLNFEHYKELVVGF